MTTTHPSTTDPPGLVRPAWYSEHYDADDIVAHWSAESVFPADEGGVAVAMCDLLSLRGNPVEPVSVYVNERPLTLATAKALASRLLALIAAGERTTTCERHPWCNRPHKLGANTNRQGARERLSLAIHQRQNEGGDVPIQGPSH